MDIKSSLRDSGYPSSQTLSPGLGFALLTIISQGLLEHILFIRAQYGAEHWDPGSSRETHGLWSQTSLLTCKHRLKTQQGNLCFSADGLLNYFIYWAIFF